MSASEWIDGPDDAASSLPLRIQRRLTRYYGLDASPAVDAFVSQRPDVERERVLVRSSDDGVEISVELPPLGDRALGLDDVCQVVEGVSHFVLLAERARRELPTTELELELQAELDKYLVLAIARERPLGLRAARDVRESLFEAPRFVHPPGTERGDRYRMAHRLAAGYASNLEHSYLRRARYGELRQTLWRFYRAGPAEKLGLARAA